MMNQSNAPLKNAQARNETVTKPPSAAGLTVGEIVESRNTIHFPPSATVKQACEMMALLSMGALPVISSDGLVGIFTERDAITKVLAAGEDPARTFLCEVMTNDVMTIGPDTKAEEARRIMLDRGFRHLPVVEESRVLGIVSIRDLMS